MTEEKIREKLPTPAQTGQTRPAHRRRKRHAAFSAGKAFFSACFGFFLGGTTFLTGVMPLGISLVSALPRYGFSALLGIWLRCGYGALLGEDLFFVSLCASAVYLARVLLCFAVYGKTLLLRAGRLPDTILLRVMLAAMFVLLFGVCDLLLTEITMEKAIAMLLSALIAAAFSFLFCFLFEEEHRGTPAFEAGLLAAAFALAFSFRPFSLGELSVGVFMGFAVTLYAGHLGSPTRSASVGLVTGLAAGGYFAPVMALSGLVSGMFSEVHPLLSGVAAVLVSVSGTLYFGGAEGVLSMLPEVLLGAFFVTVFVMLGILKTVYAKKPATDEETVLDILISRKKEAERTRHMETFSRSMRALSEGIRGVSERLRRSEPTRLSEKCREILRTHCEACPNAGTCRGIHEPERERTAGKLASRLMATGKIDRERLYEIVETRCPELDRIAEELSALAAEMLEAAIREDKTAVFAAEYEAMAELFADAACEGDMRLAADSVLSDRFRRALSHAGLYAENTLVLGDRKKFVILTGKELTRGTFDLSFLQALAEDTCHVPFAEPTFMLEKENCALVMESVPPYGTQTVVKGRAKSGESVSGDSFSHGENGDGFYHAFLCDGMGSGEEAALTAELCRVFLEKMLACGNKKSTTLDMLNHFLTSRTTECFAAVDLLEIDLVQGIASFFKSGAAPSYVIRERRVYKVASGTFPIGILPEVSVELAEFELMDGDTILLCSDGLSLDCEEDEMSWFPAFIESEWTDELSVMAEKLFAAALSLSHGTDDMTLGLIRFERR